MFAKGHCEAAYFRKMSLIREVMYKMFSKRLFSITTNTIIILLFLFR
uniref:Alternative protein SASH1 n=1 Tax=Homo sapiens TaxID=9606 RepID=L8EAS6_HUMAN|nr:alternative protein SASH1 [Homo sapiens]